MTDLLFNHLYFRHLSSPSAAWVHSDEKPLLKKGPGFHRGRRIAIMILSQTYWLCFTPMNSGFGLE
jgi:hypothetical protein